MFSTFAPAIEQELKCLIGRKWWLFVLSGVFTCLAGIAAVLIWRMLVIAWNLIRSRKENEFASDDPNRSNEEPMLNRQERQSDKYEFITEMENLSQELLSGRTTTGKILVSQFFSVHIHDYISVIQKFL